MKPWDECPRVCPVWKNYVISFLIGFGTATAVFTQSPLKDFLKREAEYTTIETPSGKFLCTKKARRLLENVKYELSLKAELGKSRFSSLVESVRDDDCLSEEHLEGLLGMVRDERSPVSRLLDKYKGPSILPEPSLDDSVRLRRLYIQYGQYRAFLLSLSDEDSDGHISELENYRAVYKLLHQ
jgi:hypothetical protein